MRGQADLAAWVRFGPRKTLCGGLLWLSSTPPSGSDADSPVGLVIGQYSRQVSRPPPICAGDSGVPALRHPRFIRPSPCSLRESRRISPCLWPPTRLRACRIATYGARGRGARPREAQHMENMSNVVTLHDLESLLGGALLASPALHTVPNHALKPHAARLALPPVSGDGANFHWGQRSKLMALVHAVWRRSVSPQRLGAPRQTPLDLWRERAPARAPATSPLLPNRGRKTPRGLRAKRTHTHHNRRKAQLRHGGTQHKHEAMGLGAVATACP